MEAVTPKASASSLQYLRAPTPGQNDKRLRLRGMAGGAQELTTKGAPHDQLGVTECASARGICA